MIRGTGARRRAHVLVVMAAAACLVACGGDASPSPSEDAPCAAELPPRTSPTDYPIAVLHVNGDDLAPVVGPVEWNGDGETVAHEPERTVNLQTFTVLQTRNQSEISIRMTDGVALEAWQLDVVPANTFRIGDFETDRTTWSEGGEPTEVVCVPIQEGSWALIGELTFADEGGSGIYYWRLNVTEVPTT